VSLFHLLAFICIREGELELTQGLPTVINKNTPSVLKIVAIVYIHKILLTDFIKLYLACSRG